MKKIIILLTALFAFAGVRANQYRLSLPYPYVEKITTPTPGSYTYLNATGESLVVQYSYPQTYYTTDELRSKLNELIASAGIGSWLTVGAVTMDTSAHTGSIMFNVAANNSGTTRGLYINAGSTEISCYQSAAVFRLSCTEQTVLPGQIVTLTLNGSTAGSRYELYRDGILVATATGTGTYLNFNQQIPYVEDDKKNTIRYEVSSANTLCGCTLKYPELILGKRARAPQQLYRIDRYGGEITLRCTVTHGDISDIAAIVNSLIRCGTADWDINKVSITTDYEPEYCDLSFIFKENTGSAPIRFRSAFLFDASGTEVVFEQAGKSPVLDQHNWICTRTFTTEKGLNWNTDMVYYDGLGREELSIQKWASPRQQDLVTLTEYDDFGRLSKKWLPFAFGNDGLWKDRQTLCWEARNYFSDNAPYTETGYESSPLKRVNEQWAPGEIMHTSKVCTATEYRTNDENELLIPYVSSDDCLAIASKPASAGTYFKQITIDPDGHLTHTFTDQQGNTVLSRRFADGVPFDTYYFYDDRHRLRGVMSPEGSRHLYKGSVCPVSDVLLRSYGYHYTLDAWGNIVNRRLPGRDYELNLYDAFDRLRARQDGVQRTNGEWEIFGYDPFGRLLWSGIVGGRISAKTMDEKIKKRNRICIEDDPEFALSATYWYDKMPATADPDLNYSRINTDWPERDTRTRGLKTYEKLAVLGVSGSVFVERAFYYDVKGRLIQTVERNHLGSISCYSTKYDFSGYVLATRESHQNPETTSWDGIETVYTYDHRGRKTSEISSIKNKEAEIHYVYDELGRISNVVYGKDAHTVKETRKYNIQNWLTLQRSSQFYMQLRYYAPSNNTTVPSYTGNITEWMWQYPRSAANTYAFTYDELSRLTGTEHYNSGEMKNLFVEKGITYDANGNILTLQRLSDGTVADNLNYTYSGNWLTTLNGASYSYDRNGNMKRDGLNDLSITYNRLNLIEKVTLGNGGTANYSYLSDGTKISATNNIDEGLVYLGSLVYTKRRGALTLESAPFGEGRWIMTTAGPETRYFIKDHLGSVRAVFNEEGRATEQNDYYPFGARWHASSIYSDNRYRYNGKEEQEFLNLPFCDYGARMYDPRTGRWVTSDPLCEIYFNSSPYCFCINNPIRFLDPDGRLVDDYFNFRGIYLGTDSASSDLVRIINNETWNLLSNDGTIDHNVGLNSSMPFSRANMNNAEALNVFEHYNMTGIPTVETSGIGGMQTTAKIEDVYQGNQIIEENVKNMLIKVDVSALKASKLYDNKNNIINTFQHEKKHVEDIKTQKGSYLERSTKKREQRAINYQRNTSSWEKTTSEFKKAVEEYEKRINQE